MEADNHVLNMQEAREQQIVGNAKGDTWENNGEEDNAPWNHDLPWGSQDNTDPLLYLIKQNEGKSQESSGNFMDTLPKRNDKSTEERVRTLERAFKRGRKGPFVTLNRAWYRGRGK